MKKVILSTVMAIALLVSLTATAQDNTKKECADKPKTECSKDKKADAKCCKDKDKKAEDKCCKDKNAKPSGKKTSKKATK